MRQNNFLKSLFVSTCLIAPSLFALPSICHERHDKLYCGAGEITDITYLGDAIFEGTLVKGVTKIIGDLSARHTKFNQLSVIGDLTATDTTLVGELNVKGDAVLANAQFSNLAVIVGNAKISKTIFRDRAKIVGDVEIDNTEFRAALNLSADKAHFTNVKSMSILFNPSIYTQNLYFHGQNTVNGMINFESNHGFVFLNKDSQILGSITGAKIVYQ